MNIIKKIIFFFIIVLLFNLTNINCYSSPLDDILRKEWNSRPPILDSWYGIYRYKDKDYKCDINIEGVVQKPHIRVFIDYRYQKKYQVLIGPLFIDSIDKTKSTWKTSKGVALILNKDKDKITISLNYDTLDNIKFRVYKKDPLTEKFESTSVTDPIIKRDLDYISKMVFTKP